MNRKSISNIVAYLTQPRGWVVAEVIEGKKRGRMLGFPTLNLKPLIPVNIKYGVYFCYITIKNKFYQGLLHYGPRPTFQEEAPVFEIYVFNFNQEIKPKTKIKFKLLKYLRKTKKFKSAISLTSQIKKDIKIVLGYNKIKKLFKEKNEQRN